MRWSIETVSILEPICSEEFARPSQDLEGTSKARERERPDGSILPNKYKFFISQSSRERPVMRGGSTRPGRAD